MRRLAPLLAISCALAVPDAASAAGAPVTASQISITGTDGRDEVVVTPIHTSNAYKIVVVGAASVSGGTLNSGSPACNPDVSAVTDRAVAVVCAPSTAGYAVSLGGADD